MFYDQILSSVQRRTMCNFLYGWDRVLQLNDAGLCRHAPCPDHGPHLNRGMDQICRDHTSDVLTAWLQHAACSISLYGRAYSCHLHFPSHSLRTPTAN
jgi:hypothetical protein